MSGGARRVSAAAPRRMLADGGELAVFDARAARNFELKGTVVLTSEDGVRALLALDGTCSFHPLAKRSVHG